MHPDTTPQTPPSGNIHGMPLAVLLGFGAPELTSIAGPFAKLDPANVALVGVRSLDAGEKKRLKETGVQVHTMSDIDRHGVQRVMKKALAHVTDGTGLVHVSMDLDAVDPASQAQAAPEHQADRVGARDVEFGPDGSMEPSRTPLAGRFLEPIRAGAAEKTVRRTSGRCPFRSAGPRLRPRLRCGQRPGYRSPASATPAAATVTSQFSLSAKSASGLSV
jgi:hypothetical protein